MNQIPVHDRGKGEHRPGLPGNSLHGALPGGGWDVFNNRIEVSLSVQSILISVLFTHDAFLYSSATIATDAAAVTAPPTTSDR
jgi:hypothetical protein